MPKQARGPQTIEKPLTATELEMMNVLWRIAPASVHQVVEALLPQRQLAYTSVSTIVRILEQKGYVRSRKEGRAHLYEPTIQKEAYQVASLQHLVSSVFDGTPTLLVQRLVDSEQLDAEELRGKIGTAPSHRDGEDCECCCDRARNRSSGPLGMLEGPLKLTRRPQRRARDDAHRRPFFPRCRLETYLFAEQSGAGGAVIPTRPV
jgi:predicted transcriptional regulator